MASIVEFYNRHPKLVAWAVLAIGMVIMLLWSAKDVGLLPTQTLAMVLATIGLAASTIGLGTYLSIQLPVLLMAGTVGVWLFYVQHQYEGVYWARHQDWDPTKAALEGSSYYKLPKLLQWITGNIGLHHIHHVQARIPNYNLQAVQDRVAAFQAVRPVTLRSSLHSLRLRLWDEAAQRLVGFPRRGSSSIAAAS